MFVPRSMVAALTLLFVAVAVPPARADVPVPSAARITHSKKKAAQSVGAPNSGKLEGAALLHGSKVVRVREGSHSWGLPGLVHLIKKAAHDVARKYRGSQMVVGDLSGRTGGPLEHHSSHQTGRDADVGFYVANANGKPVSVNSFVAFDEHGHGRELGWARFDEARNWALIESLVTNRETLVRYVFVGANLRAELLAYAGRKHVSKEIVARAAQVMTSANDEDLHDSHFHIRIGCPEAMREACVEESVPRQSVSSRNAADGISAMAAEPPGAQANREERR